MAIYSRKMINLAQIIIIILMYIFTPLNMILFTKFLGAGDKPKKENNSLEGEVPTQRRSTFNLLSNTNEKSEKKNKSPPSLLKRLDEYILKPILIRDYENRKVG